MNLLSDLRSELAVAILVEKKHSEQVNSNEALDLIDKVYDILQPVSAEKEPEKEPPAQNDAKASCH